MQLASSMITVQLLNTYWACRRAARDSSSSSPTNRQPAMALHAFFCHARQAAASKRHVNARPRIHLGNARNRSRYRMPVLCYSMHRRLVAALLLQQLGILFAALPAPDVTVGSTMDREHADELAARIALLSDSSCTWKLQRNRPASELSSIHVSALSQGIDTANATLLASRLAEPRMPLLFCKYHDKSRVFAASQQPRRVALFVIADKPAYLMTETHRNKNTNLSIWSALQSKTDYSERTGVPLFLLLGWLRERADLRKTAVRCGDNGPRADVVYVGHLKALGAIAIFRQHPDLTGVVYLDSDASIVDFNVLPEEFFALAPRADLLGSSNWKDPIIMNAGVLLFRNTEWTLRFLANWWSHRAGCNDQISLWQAVFRMWGLSVDEATWTEPTSDSLRYLTAIFRDLQRRDALLARTDPRAASLGRSEWRNGSSSQWRCEGACGWLFRWSGCLSQPLELPRVLLLPTLPVREQNVDLVALQHYSGLIYRHKTPDQWICHSDNQASRGCAPRKPLKNARNFCKWCKAAAKSARRGCFVKKQKCGMNHKITMCTYEREPKYHCGCEDTLLPQYTLLGGTSGAGLSVQAKCGGCPNATYVFNGSDARARLLATAEDGGVTASLYGAGRAANRGLRRGLRDELSGDVGGSLGGTYGGHLGGEMGGVGREGQSNESHDWAMRLHSRMVDRERKILLGKEARRTRSAALLSGGRAMMWSLRAANSSGDVRAQSAGTLPFAEQLRQAQQAQADARDGGNGSAASQRRKKQKLPKALVRAMKKKEKKSRRKAADAED